MAEETHELIGNMTDEQVKDIVRNFAEGGTLRELRGISNAGLEAIYATGLEHYRGGNYADAKKIFNMLVLLEHTSSKYWTALGGACQMLGDYQNAVKSYAVGSFMDLHNPKPMYYAAECFHKTGDKENAMRALRSLEMFGPKDTAVGKEFQAKGAALKALVEAA